MMKQAGLLFLLIVDLAFASCRPTARQAVADAEQPTDSTMAVTNADTPGDKGQASDTSTRCPSCSEG